MGGGGKCEGRIERGVRAETVNDTEVLQYCETKAAECKSTTSTTRLGSSLQPESGPMAYRVQDEVHLCVGRDVPAPALVAQDRHRLEQSVRAKLLQNLFKFGFGPVRER